MNLDKVKYLVENGMSVSKIAAQQNCKAKDIKDIILKYNLCLVKESFSDDKIDKICNLYKLGVSAKQLGKKFSIDKRRVQRWVEERGILRNKNDSHRIKFFNQNYFDKIDSATKAYWLGFFYADAYNSIKINTFSISLKREDKAHLEKLCNTLDLTTENIFDGYMSGHPYSILKLYSKHICLKMTELGCPVAKSFIITYPSWIPKKLDHHFIRGYFDGDGSLSFTLNNFKNKEWKVSIVSTNKFCESISNILLHQNIRCSINNISKTGKNTSEIEIRGNDQVFKLMNWLYSNSNQNNRLDRKHELFLNLKNQMFVKNSNISLQLGNLVKIDGQELSAKYIKQLNKSERESLVMPIYNYFRRIGWQYPKVHKNILIRDYQKLIDKEIDINNIYLNNNDRVCTNICHHFCESYYRAGTKSIIDVWNDDKKFLSVIRNRLVLNWQSKTNETFNITGRMMIQGIKSMMLSNPISMFKPAIAKYICMKYSNPGELVGDYSAGFGGRLLGATSCGRRYVGTDPLTVPDLIKMVKFYNLEETVKLHQVCSEHFTLEKNSVDLYWSSPPYFDKERYSEEKSQAYNNGENYFFDVYWKNTLKNVYQALKPNKWFGLNVKDVPLMVDMAKQFFGEPKEIIYLYTRRNHLNKSSNKYKLEPIYMFYKNA